MILDLEKEHIKIDLQGRFCVCPVFYGKDKKDGTSKQGSDIKV